MPTKEGHGASSLALHMDGDNFGPKASPEPHIGHAKPRAPKPRLLEAASPELVPAATDTRHPIGDLTIYNWPSSSCPVVCLLR